MLDLKNKNKIPGVIICCGSGGVGKTTISATLGLHAALNGHNTLVVTIDPAKRLADSLGLDSLKSEEQIVSDEKFLNVGIKPKGKLFAMMLDPKRTFDNLIEKYASKNAKDKILNNRYYQHLSTTMAGSHEYMAMEKLFEIYSKKKYDLIILDTPPSRRALDFLDAPDRLINLLGHNFFFKIFRPYYYASKFSFRMLSLIASPFLKVVGQVIGPGTLEDIGDFFELWDDIMFEGFSKRAQAVKNLLSSEESLFFAIASPMYAPMRESVYLYEKLKEYNIPFGGFIINRVHPVIDDDYIKDDLSINNDYIDSMLKNKLIKNFVDFQKMGRSDQLNIEALKKVVDPDIKISTISYLEQDVYDFKGLIKMSGQLFGE